MASNYPNCSDRPLPFEPKAAFPIRAIILLLLSWVLVSACQNRDPWAGKYEIETGVGVEDSEVTLTLFPDGKGIWATAEDNAQFRWEIRNRQIWLHTNDGGVLVGELSKNTITVSLPGDTAYRFTKIE